PQSTPLSLHDALPILEHLAEQIARGEGTIGRLFSAEGPSSNTGRDVPKPDWLARFRAAKSWRDGLAIGEEIAKLPDAEALSVMRDRKSTRLNSSHEWI